MQYGFNTPGYGPTNDCCGEPSTCTRPCPSETTNGWYNPFFGGYTNNWNSPFFGGYTSNWNSPFFGGYTSNWNAPFFGGYTSNWNSPYHAGYTSNWNSPFFGGQPNGWTGGFENGQFQNFHGAMSPFPGFGNYAATPGTTPGGNPTQNVAGPTWAGCCSNEAACA